MKDQKLYFVRTFYFCFNCDGCVAVQRKYGKQFFVQVTIGTIYQLVRQFKGTESVCVINMQRDIYLAYLFLWKKLRVQQ
jgi:hypothetical protein